MSNNSTIDSMNEALTAIDDVALKISKMKSDFVSALRQDGLTVFLNTCHNTLVKEIFEQHYKEAENSRKTMMHV